jgi:uncharacterized protein YndB with AHSA1/START domain
MGIVRRSVRIQAPVEHVFEYLTDPTHLPEVWPSLIEVTNAEHAPDGGHRFDWVYKLAGLRLHGHAETVATEKNRTVVVKSDHGLPATFRWHYDGTEGETWLRLEVEYGMPVPLVDKLAAPLLRRMNEHEVALLLGNVKAKMELKEEIDAMT